MPQYVYELVDPRTGIPRYVGVTNDLTRRLRTHIHNIGTSNKAKGGWVQELDEEGLVPDMRVIEIVQTWKEVLEREKYWIQHYIQQGIPLTNIAGISCKETGETPRDMEIDEVSDGDVIMPSSRLLDTDTNRKCLTTAQARVQADLSGGYISRLLRDGELEGFKMNREWFIYLDSLDRFLAKKRKPGPKGQHS